jgi:tRNA (guanine-N7-)-methyltransferase
VSGGEVAQTPHHGHVSSPLLEPGSYIERLDLAAVFPNSGPVEVDLGCGDGSFMCALARQFPSRNFLGIERLAGRVETAAGTAAAMPNVRVMRVESSYAVRYLLPPCSVSTFYVFFPDPWPKRRHQRRRVINAPFLEAARDALEVNGLIHIATDQAEYFQKIERLARETQGLAKIDAGHLNLPPTKFEARFANAGATIYRLSLRKVSPVT